MRRRVMTCVTRRDVIEEKQNYFFGKLNTFGVVLSVPKQADGILSTEYIDQVGTLSMLVLSVP
jgi:hypothetical protein